MRPKVFIGSSVEGLNIAYAIQQNLTHDAESTVWNQGVFDLSQTTIESLDKILEKMDFGIFVFSSDDVTIMRNKESSSVRDNVLFEFGLFIGKIGRNRVFFIIPDGSSVHLPSDLLGITPGKYEVNRADGSFQAATGSVCNQIRTQIKSLGILREQHEYETPEDIKDTSKASESDWFIHYLNHDFKLAKENLEKEIGKKSGNEKFKDEIWLSYLKLKLNDKKGLEELCNATEVYKDNLDILQLIPQMLCWEYYNKKAVEVAEKVYLSSGNSMELGIVLAYCYEQDGNREKALEIFDDNEPSNNPKVALALANIYEDGDIEKLKVFREAYVNNSNDEELIYRFARELQNHDSQKEALYLLDFLGSVDICF